MAVPKSSSEEKIVPELFLKEAPTVVQNGARFLFGDHEAEFLQQIVYWRENPFKDYLLELETKVKWHEGRLYVRVQPELLDNPWTGRFRHLSESTRKRTIKSCKEQGLLLTANLNTRRDNTNCNWYAVVEEVANPQFGLYNDFLSRVKEERRAALDGGGDVLALEREYELHREFQEALEILRGELEEQFGLKILRDTKSKIAEGQNDTVPSSLGQKSKAQGQNDTVAGSKRHSAKGQNDSADRVKTTPLSYILKRDKKDQTSSSSKNGSNDGDDDDDFLNQNNGNGVLLHPNSNDATARQANQQQASQSTAAKAIGQGQQVLVPSLEVISTETPENAAAAKKLAKFLGRKQAEHFLRDLGVEQCAKYLRELELIVEQRARNNGEPIESPGGYLLALFNKEAGTPLADAEQERAEVAQRAAERTESSATGNVPETAQDAQIRAASEAELRELMENLSEAQRQFFDFQARGSALKFKYGFVPANPENEIVPEADLEAARLRLFKNSKFRAELEKMEQPAVPVAAPAQPVAETPDSARREIAVDQLLVDLDLGNFSIDDLESECRELFDWMDDETVQTTVEEVEHLYQRRKAA